MDTLLIRPLFDLPDVGRSLATIGDTELDELDFGVIGFDRAGVVRVYNRFESAAAGLAPSSVLGQSLFDAVAPCMNNYLIAERFADAAAHATALDDTIDYVLTLRMRPTRVRLRLVADPDSELRYVLLERRTPATDVVRPRAR